LAYEKRRNIWFDPFFGPGSVGLGTQPAATATATFTPGEPGYFTMQFITTGTLSTNTIKLTNSVTFEVKCCDPTAGPVSTCITCTSTARPTFGSQGVALESMNVRMNLGVSSHKR
jgi:hypothetical protein